MAEEKQQIYEEAEMDNLLGYGASPVLLVVDLQTGFTDPENPLGGDLTDVIDSTNRLLDVAHDRGVPVVFSRVITKHRDMTDLGVWGEKIPSLRTLHKEGGWVEIDPQLNRREGDHILDKQQASAFHETELGSMLNSLQVDTVVVTGCTTSGCVRATVVDACAHGFYTIVPDEAVGDRAMEPHEANLFDINAKYGDVRPVDEVINYLSNENS